MGKTTEKSEPIRLENKVLKIGKQVARVQKSTRRARATMHAVDMKVARSELGPLNLDYAKADKAMLKQALKLRKRFG